MKKTIATILLLSMCVGFYGCSNAVDNTTSTLQTSATETELQASENNLTPLELGVPVTAGIWEYTLLDIQFAKEVGNYPEYENYLIPGGKSSGSNPYALKDNETLAVVTYKLKMIGKEAQRPWDIYDGAAVGTGKFIYGDGFVFESRSDGDRAEANYFDGTKFRSMITLNTLEPLSDEIECRVAFTVPVTITESVDEALAFEVSFNELGDNMTFRYVIR